ncbi:Arm DNA-binding domain-containing protein [Pseudomonas mediterranea]|uniref:Arm DNA-binding domain-containing protein n=1 Tax=Pseudomonas mediterranea TaxID=183795 RepID=UPI001F4C809F|nr:Arm DNA-binding domain-containing protein [Pseudomonas mediterranea]
MNTKGSKSWHFRFSWAGKHSRISLGTYPEIDLRDARTLRDVPKAVVAEGGRSARPSTAERNAKRLAMENA